MIIRIPICINCKYFDRKNLEKNVCEAFPEGIPGDILSCEFTHIKKYPGQKNDIVFEEEED